MASLDHGPWLQNISADAPTGPNLEFDPDFTALERSAQGKPEQQFGKVIVPAEEPEWKEVVAQSVALMARTRDLRVLALLAISRLQLFGFEAFAEILTLTRQILETQWEKVHPQLDPDDDNDPTLRANALLSLTDNRRVLRLLREMPLASSPRTGQVSWRDISIALGTLEPDPGKDKPKESVIIGTFREADPARVAGMRAALVTALAELTAIPAVFDGNSGFGTGPDFAEIVKLVREMQRFVERFAPAAEQAAAPEPVVEQPISVAEEGGVVHMVAASNVRAAGPVAATSLTSIVTRAEALHLLGLVVQYYERYEPSSPLPLLIDRARRLADKPFLDILRDLAPDGITQAQNIAGAANDAAV